MKNALYAVVAASIAMFSTGSLVALATAAPLPSSRPLSPAESALVEMLDEAISERLGDMKFQLHKR